MNICFFCDLHLSTVKGAPQYSALEWAISDMKSRDTDLAIYVGDVTSDGNRDVYYSFIERMNDSGLDYLFIPGNSDVRDERFCDELVRLSSDVVNVRSGVKIYAVNDATGYVDDETLNILDASEDGGIVFMHHPVHAHPEKIRTRLEHFKETHPNSRIFFGHVHRFYEKENDVSLQALDPDKAIGECPCITYYDTDSRDITRSYFDCPVPDDIYDYIGISSYRPEEHILLATERDIRYLELRPNVASMDEERLLELISGWRRAGGEHLSIHLPEIGYADGEVITEKSLDRLIYLADLLGADRFTQHVPRVSVKAVRENNECLSAIAEALGKKLDKITREIVVGVENMHMTNGENPDDSRRFGYIPSECLEFMNELAKHTRHRVGINLDVGHARNNAPFSQNYQIGAWYSEVGPYAVGYHIHQVKWGMEKWENHTAITDVYGNLISYASFFRMWSDGKMAKAPFVFEMDSSDAYEVTLATFEKEKQKMVR